MKWNPLNTSIGLALGGGAGKGIAHIGAIKALEEAQVPIACVAGTSIGALVASYFAFGKKADEIMAVAQTLKLNHILSFKLKKLGLFSSDSIKKMVVRDLGDVRIEQAQVPLAICTTDIETGELVILESGNLAEAIAASMAVPGLYIPVTWEDRLLVDGGIVENVPITPLEMMGAGIIVAVDLNAVTHYPKPQDIGDVISNAIDISIDLKTREQIKRADIALKLNLSGYNRFDNTERAEALFMEGYRPMRRKAKRLLWYKRANYVIYVFKVIQELIPVKFPNVIKQKQRQRKQPIKKIK